MNNNNTGNAGKAEQKEILEKVRERFQDADKYRYELEERWRRYYQLYRSRAKAKPDKTRANIFVPEVFTSIETLIPRLISPYLSRESPIIKVTGREPGDDKNARAGTMLLSYQFARMELSKQLVTFFKQALMYGTSVGKIYWDYRMAEDGTILYDDPVFEVLDLFDFYVDPDAVDISDARYCIHRKFISREELMERGERGIYKNVDKITGGKGDDNRKPRYNTDFPNSRSSSNLRDIEILEYWEEDRVVVVGGREVVLRDSPNPFRHKKMPFVKIVFVPIPFEFYGIGVIEPIEGLQNELNTKRNQRLDNVNMVINRMWLVQRGSLDDFRQLHSRPGGIILVNDLNGIQPLPAPDVTSSSYNEEDIIKRDIQNTSGVSDYIRGVMSVGKETATEVSIKAEQGQSRFQFNFKFMAETGVKKIAEMTLKLNQQFMNREKTIRLMGSQGVEFVNIKPSDIAGDFDLIPIVKPLDTSESDRRQQLISLFPLLSRIPGVNLKPLAENILQLYNIQNTDEIMNPQEEDLPIQSKERTGNNG